jgi:hypothetical protein
VTQAAQVDKYQTVRFDRNRYSVPRACAYRAVTVKGYIDRVEVVHNGQAVARHARSYGHDQQVLDPLHYLAALDRRPAALDHAPVYRDWQLPPAFAQLRADLEGRLGPAAGARHYIRVLQLLAAHPVGRVGEAIAACRRRGALDAAAIGTAAARRATDNPVSLDAPAAPATVTVPPPDLSRFDQLLSQLSQGEDVHE